MATNEFSASQIDNDNLSNNENYNPINIQLYHESTISRQQAINNMADIILSSDMKPQFVIHMLKLFKNILPSDNTLPTTVDELFHAMMSSENDWRLVQYFLRHKQYRSLLLPATSNICNESSTQSDDSTLMEQQNEIDTPMPTSCVFTPLNYEDSLSSSDSESSCSCTVCQSKLQEHLEPMISLPRDFPLQSHLNNDDNNIPSLNPWSSLMANIATSPTVFNELQQSFSETPSRSSNNRQHLRLLDMFKQFEDSDEDDTSDCSLLNSNKKPCCFEVNGYNLLGGNIRHRYF